MYLYEEMNLNELLDDPEVDPDSPDALYAIAQCYRLGKGTDVNEELYRSNLEAAAQAGSEAARQELAGQDTAAEETPAASDDLADLPLYQQRRMAEEGNPAAIFLMAQNSRALNDANAELSYLQRAEKLVGTSVYTPEQEQQIFLQLAELYSRAPLEDPQKSVRYYGLASELGSAEAALALSRCARTGYGCAADPVQAEAWMRRAAECGDFGVKYELALELLDSKPVDAYSLLDEVMHSADEESLRLRAEVMLASRQAGGLPAEEMDNAWSVCEAPEIASLILQSYDFPAVSEMPEVPEGMTGHPLRTDGDGLNLLMPEGETDYGTINGLPVVRECAEWLFERTPAHSRRILWAQCAALMGSESAANWLEADELCSKGMALLPTDPEQANACLRRAVDLGSSRAGFYLGISLYNGRGIAQDQAAAAQMLLSSAQAGYVESMRVYAELFLPGTVDSNPEKRSWIEQAARSHSVDALFTLCCSQNPGDSLAHLGYLAQSGDVSAQYLLARCYAEGHSVQKSPAEAVKWFQEAARPRPEGQFDLKRNTPIYYAHAAANIADYYIVNGSKDPQQTFRWAKEAYDVHQAVIPELGAPAPFCYASVLGNCYAFGIGTAVDYDQALACYRSVDERYEFAAPAWAGIGRCYLNGQGVEKDLTQARAYFDKARQAGYNVGDALLRQLANEEAALNQQRLAAEQQAASERDYTRCARYLLAFLLAFVLKQVLLAVHIPVIGMGLVSVISITEIVLFFAVAITGYKLYQGPNGSRFGSRLGAALRKECSSIVGAAGGLFRSRRK